MALGKPLLATWYADGTLRLYELIDGVFAQQAAAGPFIHTPSAHPDGVVFQPPLDFGFDSQILLLRHASSADLDKLKVLNRDLTVLSDTSASSGTNTAAGPGFWDEIHSSTYKMHIAQAVKDRFKVTVAGAVSAGDADYWSPVADRTTIRGLWISPDGEYLLQGGKTTTTTYMRKSAGQDANGPQFTTAQQVQAIIDIACWTPDSKYVVAGSKATGLSVYQLNAGTWQKLYDITKKTGTVEAIAASRNGRYMAISHNNGGVITTTIYTLSGPYLVESQTLSPGFGKALAFTSDTGWIIDAISKVAYQRTLSGFAEAPGAMTNVVSGAVVQALSTHIENPVGFTKLYNNRLGDFLEGQIDLSKLKITLAGNSAPAFDPSHTTLAQAVGSAEVTTGNWPAGGLALPNVQAQRIGSQRYGITSDPVERILIMSGASFRYGIVYEETAGGNKPLLHIDFEKVYSIPKGTKITIQFNADGIIAFGG